MSIGGTYTVLTIQHHLVTTLLFQTFVITDDEDRQLEKDLG